ncbi:MAG: radical SAM protein, partial [Bdellovibrionales bacterium]|nr:hypothetical protein [Bdellovibrionales bacterium]NQZ19617.1 radical SAM protein [Bdellovibrionales bacterium]
KDVVEEEFTQAIEAGQVKEIYWVGGEPLLWPIHWKSMSYLAENNLSKDVFVRYNSNLGTIERKGVHLFSDLIPQFKDFNMCASIDGFGAIGEFIRTGLSWEKWKTHFEEGLKIADPNKHDQMVMDVTLTLPGLFAMKELFDQSLEWDVKMYVKIVFDFDPSIVLSPFALPRPVLDELLDDLIAYCEPKTNSKNSALVDTFKVMKKRPVFETKYPDTWKSGFVQGRDHQKKLARIRKDGQEGRLSIEDIYQKHPKVLEWWQQEL